jgi:acyl dehydratase
MADETQLFLEDFSKGQIFLSPPRTITEADVLSFAGLTGDAIHCTMTMNTPRPRGSAGRSSMACT